MEKGEVKGKYTSRGSQSLSEWRTAKGNSLVLAAIACRRGRTRLTPTNVVLAHLAAAEAARTAVCLPATAAWDVTETWALGTAFCKVHQWLLSSFATFTVLVLTFVACDRWRALRLTPFVPNMMSPRTVAVKMVLLAAISGLSSLPELLTLTTIQPAMPVDTVLFTQCAPEWSEDFELLYLVCKAVLCFLLPLIFMSVAYFKITRRLICLQAKDERRWTQCEEAPIAALMRAQRLRHLRRKRKVTTMLSAVSVVYICSYAPSVSLGLLRHFVQVRDHGVRVALSMLAHWMCYANAAFNPFVLICMSANLRADVRDTFLSCCWQRSPPAGNEPYVIDLPPEEGEEGPQHCGCPPLPDLVLPALDAASDATGVTADTEVDEGEDDLDIFFHVNAFEEDDEDEELCQLPSSFWP